MVDKRDEADKLIDKLIAGKTPEEIVGEGGLLAALTKRVYERALDGELIRRGGLPAARPRRHEQRQLPERYNAEDGQNRPRRSSPGDPSRPQGGV